MSRNGRNNKEMSHRLSTSDDDSGCALEEYAWVPSGLHPMMVQQYFAHLPEEKVPYVKSAGAKWRVRQLLLQLPPQDSQPRYCRMLNASQDVLLRAFDQQRRREALGQGCVQVLHRRLISDLKCHECAQCLNIGDLVICANRLADNHVWHPYCFICHTCRELLIDLIYFHKDGRIYCGRHHAELLKPRCGACDEIIFADECIEAEGHSWHLEHFLCHECNASLGGCRYVMRDGRPYCLRCFDVSFVQHPCATCRQSIAVTDARMTYGRLQWHASKQCFLCYACGACLLGASFSCPGDQGRLFCDQQCQRAFDHKHPDMNPDEESKDKAIYRETCLSRAYKTCDRLKQCSVDAYWTDQEEEEDEPEEIVSEAVYETIASNLNSCCENSDSSSVREEAEPPKTVASAPLEPTGRSVDSILGVSFMRRSLPDLNVPALGSNDKRLRKPVTATKETTFGVGALEESPSSSTAPSRSVRFNCRPTLHHFAKRDEWRRGGYCSTCSSSSSSSSDDEDEAEERLFYPGPKTPTAGVMRCASYTAAKRPPSTRRRQNCIVS